MTTEPRHGKGSAPSPEGPALSSRTLTERVAALEEINELQTRQIAGLVAALAPFVELAPLLPALHVFLQKPRVQLALKIIGKTD